MLGRTRLPAMIHPEFWSRRRIRFPGLDPAELPATSRAALEDLGFAIVEDRRPSFLLDGAALITGEVDRTTDFEIGFRGHEALRDGAWEPDPLILDDQALVVRLRDRGLVVLSGCGHAGIVNTVRYARRLTGEDAGRRGHRRLPPQRADVRAGHRADGRGVRGPRARAARPRALHRLARGPPAGGALPRRVRDEHGRERRSHCEPQGSGFTRTRWPRRKPWDHGPGRQVVVLVEVRAALDPLDRAPAAMARGRGERHEIRPVHAPTCLWNAIASMVLTVRPDRYGPRAEPPVGPLVRPAAVRRPRRPPPRRSRRSRPAARPSRAA